MAPLRRYIRLTKTCVLESRIYLDDPSLLNTWLLRARDPVLARVVRAVRPLVLPKLREENERSRRRSGKKKSIKDVVVEDDFEVSIFLTETTTRHSILFKRRHLRDNHLGRLQSSSKRLTAGVGDDHDAPIYLGDDNDDDDDHDNDNVPGLRRESGDEDDGDGALAALDSIPSLEEAAAAATRRGKRVRGDDDSPVEVVDLRGDDDDDDAGEEDDDDNDDDDGDDDDGGGAAAAAMHRPAKRPRNRYLAGGEDDGDGGGGGDDKKKLGVDLTYEGFAIYGRVLCLIIKKRETAAGAAAAGAGAESAAKGQKAAPKTGQAIMENWIMSTQIPAGEE